MGSMVYQVPFLRPSTVSRSLTVVSRCLFAQTHWGFGGPGVVRCGGPRCAACAEGMRAEVRALLRLEDPDGSHYLFESKGRHWPVIAELRSAQSRARTLRLEIRKLGPERNSPVELHILGEVAWHEPYLLDNLARTCWREAVLLPDNREEPQVRPSSVGGRVQDTGICGRGELTGEEDPLVAVMRRIREEKGIKT